MILTLKLTRVQEKQLRTAAECEGVDPSDLALRLLTERLPSATASAIPATPVIDQENLAAIEMLQSWRQEDYTEDPEELRQAEQELAEFKRAMNANRAATGERAVFR